MEKELDIIYNNSKEYAIWRTELIEKYNIKESLVPELHKLLTYWHEKGQIEYKLREKKRASNAWDIRINTLSKEEWYNELKNYIDSKKNIQKQREYNYSEEILIKFPNYLDQIKKLKSKEYTSKEISEKLNLQINTVNQLVGFIRAGLRDEDEYNNIKNSLGYWRDFIGGILASDNEFVIMLALHIWEQLEKNGFYVQEASWESPSIKGIINEFEKENIKTLQFLGSNIPLKQLKRRGRDSQYKHKQNKLKFVNKSTGRTFFSDSYRIEEVYEDNIPKEVFGWFESSGSDYRYSITKRDIIGEKGISFAVAKDDNDYEVWMYLRKINKGYLEYHFPGSSKKNPSITPRELVGKYIFYTDFNNSRKQVAEYILKKMKEEKIDRTSWWWINDKELVKELQKSN
tara:strand:+ start:546 stop:1748 length:1203 start_codon:yes stop_codon:yes gene_type:complete